MKEATLATTLLIGSLSLLLPESIKANPFTELSLIGKNCIRLSPRSMTPTFIRKDLFLRSNYLKRYRYYSTLKGKDLNDLVKDPTAQSSKVNTNLDSKTLGKKFHAKLSFARLKKSVVD
ncbi:MAG: hypothetical protein K2P93_01345 [Alphaproteobacteria bacterium]|nr:hypothetical protein [Alphaproteobacteria bacterium]